MVMTIDGWLWMDLVDYLASLFNYYDFFGSRNPFVTTHCLVLSRRRLFLLFSDSSFRPAIALVSPPTYISRI